MYQVKQLNSTIIILSLALFGCGSGGDSNDSNQVGNTEISANTATTSQTQLNETKQVESSNSTQNIINETEQTVKTQDLIVEQSFGFKSTSSLRVNIELNDLEGIPSFASICQQDDTGEIDRRNCLYQGNLNQGKLAIEVKLANHVQGLNAEIWLLDGSAKHLKFTWNKNLGQVWSIN